MTWCHHEGELVDPLTRIPLEPAPWKQEVSSKSVYGQIEKRLIEVEFKTSCKDLRAPKQILEVQKCSTRTRYSQKDKKQSQIGQNRARKRKELKSKKSGSKSQ
ncbi:longifoli 2-like protein [Tanacetum coccineum]|uniref:Longifoli 2-like protein n=1 Tax=Tanacetum coccineum TaxID=301880 RepID=A0ABQ5ENC3_9ASTR